MSDNPKVLRLADYRRPEFTTDHVDLDFQIHEDHTDVVSKVTYKRTGEGQGATELLLHAESPNPKEDYLKSLTVNGVPLAEGTGYTYDKDNGEIRIPLDPDEDTVDVEVRTYLEPHVNHALTGLYKSDSCYVTQCESEGFRRITPFLDRPDVLAKYDVRVEAPADLCPALLANGNKTGEGAAANGRHWATFHDPIPKPCYLFATANGKLEAVSDVLITKSGRHVNLNVWTEEGKSERGRHALSQLKRFLEWDEKNFDAEYDLDDFHIVTVAKFTFGAMENTGLNVFRDSLILASPETATDDNYQRITDVVGHEAAHKKSGNAVTLANWFHLSLKEGLTVNREQMFTAFTTSKAVERINAVQVLRAGQFAEDDGPLAHAVLPQEVQSVDNIYSGTIYQKGSEVIRMMKTMMGEETFMDAVKHYFSKHDGQAVTINEFVQCMEDVSGLNFSGQFFRWYTDSGRPRIKAEGHYDAAAQTYSLTLEQHTPPTKDQPVKPPRVIPVKMGLVDNNGNDMKLVLGSDRPTTPGTGETERVIILDRPKQTFVFENITEEPAFHSLFRDFSAPVDVDPGLADDQLYAQLLHDTDGFNRWDAGQKLAIKEMVRLYNEYSATGTMPAVDPRYLDSISTLLNDTVTDYQLTAMALSLPDIKEFEGYVKPADPTAISAVRKHLRSTIGNELHSELSTAFARVNDGKPYSFDYDSVGKRSLKGIAVSYLTANGGWANIKSARNLYFSADNMTDQMTAISAIRNHMGPEREEVFDDFYQRFQDDPLVIQKWFMMQALSESDQVIDYLKDILNSPVFDETNPGHVQSIFRGFTGNYDQFHRADGKGYAFLADAVIHMDGINSHVSSGLIPALCRWRDYDPAHGGMMVAQLERINAQPGLSRDVKERILKSLPDDQERAHLPTPQIS